MPKLIQKRSMLLRLLVIVALLISFFPIYQASAAPDFKVLVFSKTAGFRHDSIPAGIAAIQALGTANNFQVDATEDATKFTTANLAQYATVIFLSTTGDVLDATQQAAFQSYIQAGHGYVGIHAASDTLHNWPWYGQLVGAYFISHPAPAGANVKIEDTVHPSTVGLPAVWARTDEWYNFDHNPRATVHVLAAVDESSYAGGGMGADHPIAWCQKVSGGNSWYTAMGHTPESFSDPLFKQHLLGGIKWTAGKATGDCSAPSGPKLFSIKANANGNYVSIANTGAVLIANKTTIGVSEQFEVIALADGNVALKSKGNGMYVTAENAGNNPLVANRTAVGPWEEFTKADAGNGQVSFKAKANGKYVTAENAGAAALIANRTAVGAWEKFTLN